MSTVWRYFGSDERIVVRTLDNGDQESSLSSAPDVLAWVAEGNAIAPYQPSLVELLARVTVLREQHLAAGMVYNTHSWDSDDRSRANISGTVAFVASGNTLPAGFTWRTKDNIDVPMANADIVALGAAMLQYVNACYANSWSLKAQLQAAPNPATVDLTAGWPVSA